jgi:hypothetical protein
VKALFPKYRREMKPVQWGDLYNTLNDTDFDPAELEERVSALVAALMEIQNDTSATLRQRSLR